MRKFIFFVLAISVVACASADPEGKGNGEEGVVKMENGQADAPEKVTFPSVDGLLITGNLFHLSDDAPVILLCHQARFNKHEYDAIAPKLNKMGFNCLAIDQRSGGPMESFENETHQRAKEKKLPVDYTDAEQDILAAIDWLSDKYGKNVILWGSSYSSALALFVAASNEKVNAVISFSPGDYFGDAKPLLKDVLADFSKPMFVTSSKEEADELAKIFEGKELNGNQIRFVPSGTGWHGSRALWEENEGNEEYWEAIKGFLEGLR